MKILVTGGAGFIGSHLCEKLLQQGYEVVCLDNFNHFYDHTLKRENISGCGQHEGFKLIESDLLDMGRVKSFCSAEKVDAVVHLAAYTGSRQSVQDPFSCEENNVRGTLNILHACKEVGVSKFVFGSTYAVYGLGLPVPFKETHVPQRQASPMGATKLAGEALCHAYHHIHGIDTAVLRYFSVFGPRQRPGTALHEFMKKGILGKPVKKIGGGDISRDFIWIDDAVDATIKAVEKCQGFETYNVGSGSCVTVDEVLLLVSEVLVTKLQIEEAEPSPAVLPAALADITKAKLKLGWKPAVDFQEGLSRLAEWMKSRSFDAGDRKSIPPAQARSSTAPGDEPSPGEGKE
jgi:UDP-glucuronate 4-epimerase